MQEMAVEDKVQDILTQVEIAVAGVSHTDKSAVADVVYRRLRSRE